MPMNKVSDAIKIQMSFAFGAGGIHETVNANNNAAIANRIFRFIVTYNVAALRRGGAASGAVACYIEFLFILHSEIASPSSETLS